MLKNRPLGVTILGILFIIGGIISVSSISFYLVSMSKERPKFDAEKYRELFFRNRQPSEQELEAFEKYLPRMEKIFRAQVEASRDPYLIGFKVWHLIMGSAAAALGAGLLMLKENARKMTIFFQSIAAVVGSIGGYLAMKINYEIMSQHLQAELADGVMGKFIVPGVVIFQSLLLGVIAFSVIFYLTRPKVKEQFS